MKAIDVEKYSVKKPCAECPIEKRDACWKSSEFACDTFWTWLHNRAIWIDEQIEKAMEGEK